MWRKGMKTRDENTELNWISLQEQATAGAKALAEALMPEEPNRGPYRLWAFREHQIPGDKPAFEIASTGPYLTLADITIKTATARAAFGYWYEVTDQDGNLVAQLVGNVWMVEQGEAQTSPSEQSDEAIVFRAMVMALAGAGKEKRPDLARRIDRAVSIVVNGEWKEADGGDFIIKSQSRDGLTHTANGACDCEHFTYRGRTDPWCTHRLARMLVVRAREEIAGENGGDGQGQAQEARPVGICRICQDVHRGDGDVCERCERETALPMDARAWRVGRNGNDSTRSKMWK